MLPARLIVVLVLASLPLGAATEGDPDVKASSVWSHGQSPGAQTIVVTVHNVGRVEIVVVAIDLEAFHEGDGARRDLGTIYVIDLFPSQVKSIALRWDTLGEVGTIALHAHARVANEIQVENNDVWGSATLVAGTPGMDALNRDAQAEAHGFRSTAGTTYGAPARAAEGSLNTPAGAFGGVLVWQGPDGASACGESPVGAGCVEP